MLISCWCIHLPFMQKLLICKVRGNCISTIPVKQGSFACLESLVWVGYSGWKSHSLSLRLTMVIIILSHPLHLHFELSLLQFKLTTSCTNQHHREQTTLFLFAVHFVYEKTRPISSLDSSSPEQPPFNLSSKSCFPSLALTSLLSLRYSLIDINLPWGTALGRT